MPEVTHLETKLTSAEWRAFENSMLIIPKTLNVGKEYFTLTACLALTGSLANVSRVMLATVV